MSVSAVVLSHELISGLTYFMPLVYFYCGRSSCHIFPVSCLFMDTDEPVNSILYVKMWDVEKRHNGQISGNTKKLHCKFYFLYNPIQQTKKKERLSAHGKLQAPRGFINATF